jgi:hypothetical protein
LPTRQASPFPALGQPGAARLVSPLAGGRSVYYSRFDRAVGDGRIHPNAPLNLNATEDETGIATQWHPPVTSYEDDPRPFGQVLKSWGAARGLTRAQQAAAIGVPVATLDNWHKGRPAALELTVRRLLDRL